MSVKPLTILGKDTIYVCQSCGGRDKEFAYPDRHSKYCSKCGGLSIKSTLADSYNYVAAGALQTTTAEVDNSKND